MITEIIGLVMDRHFWFHFLTLPNKWYPATCLAESAFIFRVAWGEVGCSWVWWLHKVCLGMSRKLLTQPHPAAFCSYHFLLTYSSLPAFFLILCIVLRFPKTLLLFLPDACCSWLISTQKGPHPNVGAPLSQPQRV